MTHFSDGLTIGNPRGFGAGRALPASLTSYVITPATLDRDGFCAAQQRTGAGDLTLNGALVVGGVGKTDVPRAVGIYSAADLSAITFTIYGYDTYAQPVREQVAGPNNTTKAMKKAFAAIVRVTSSATVGSDVEVGTIDVFGLPTRVIAAATVAWVGWNALTRDTGTLAVADDTSPATATTGDVRGTYVPSSAANGSKVLGMVLLPIKGARHLSYGVTQYGTGVG